MCNKSLFPDTDEIFNSIKDVEMRFKEKLKTDDENLSEDDIIFIRKKLNFIEDFLERNSQIIKNSKL